jgi:Fe-S-cluster-containing dehydrogenase component/DMSO reductase anchor subunit
MDSASLILPSSPRSAATSANDGGGREKRRVHLKLVQYLSDQQQLTAVERFSNKHDLGEVETRDYRDLIPRSRPGAGQQYAFHVDMDACTGCKACVTACHSLNGLDEGEVWRKVGLLIGSSGDHGVQKTVTAACHHCVDPACLAGCPVKAYEKDPVTGIVRHLDDQCIGCQYCVFTCPYEVPRFNEKKGIVRKCDMCTDRLEVGEAPACVQGCPNEAISIRLVDQQAVVETAQADAFLPAAPSPTLTLPTTVYQSKTPLPKNTLPADFYSVKPAARHAPLVLMLVLTQLAAGVFTADLLLSRWFTDLAPLLRPFHAGFALLIGLVALGASTLHLGRPQFAYRALLGLRTSWLSREILAFGAFAGLAMAYAGLLWSARLPALGGLSWFRGAGSGLYDVLAAAVAIAGLGGVLCSVMVYHVTGRRFWNGAATGVRFFGTCVVLGSVVTLMSATLAVAWLGSHGSTELRMLESLALFAAAAGVAKLAFELSIFRHLFDRRHTDLKRSALLMRRDLMGKTVSRVACGGIGGVVLPIMIAMVVDSVARGVHSLNPAWLSGAAIASALGVLSGEILERSLFFTAMSSPRMPGAQGG